MARFSEYLDTKYLPGEVYGAGLSEYRDRPQEVVDYLAAKKFKFTPDTDDGTYFQTFLALQNNPEALFESKLQVPKNFQTFMALSGRGT